MNQQSNKRFNNLINYIEENLCEEINYKKLSQILGVNEYTMQRIFLFVTNYTLGEYIRKRRLSMSALDLLEGKEKVIDIAIKYNYESSQAFSRAFKSMMGFLPSQIDDNKNDIKFFPQYEIINEEITDEFNYHIEKNKEFKFYAISMKTTIKGCHKEAPTFWKENLDAIKEKFENSQKLNLKTSNYLVFELDFINADYLYEYSSKIYRTIIPNSGYELEDLPDIEEYLPNKKLRLYIPIK